MRQLRRRYDILRQDYESLIDRLLELEERVADDEARRAGEAPPPSAPLPASEAPGEPLTVAESLLGPLLRLRDEYLVASTGIQSIIAGLDQLASSAFSRTQAAPPAQPGEPSRPPAPSEPVPFQVDVRGEGFGELLDFQERLTNLPGVARVSISAIDNERATLIVELNEPG